MTRPNPKRTYWSHHAMTRGTPRARPKTKTTPTCRDAARADAICDKFEKSGDTYWEAYDQGAWTWCVGMPRSDNPYIKGHKHWPEWNRGWDEEAAAHQPDEDRDPDT